MVEGRQEGRSSGRSRPGSWATPTSRSREGLQEGEEIVSGSYKTLRTLKDDARIKIEDKSKKKS